MDTVNQSNYSPKEGIKSGGRSRTQLAEYQPLDKMLANLTIAGLNASAKQALEYYDGNDGGEIDIPLLPRHINPDINSVHAAAKYFAEQKQRIEDKVRLLREKRIQEEIRKQAESAKQNPPGGVSGASSP